jgi:hypothetical protein
MARAELRDSWYVSGSAAALRRRLLRFFREHKMKLVFDEEGEFHSLRAAQGSQLWTRLLGGWFVSSTTLPKEARVTFSETSKGLLLRVTIEETMGFGFLDPILAEKYKKFFEDWMCDVEDALAADSAAPEKPEQGIREKPPRKHRMP